MVISGPMPSPGRTVISYESFRETAFRTCEFDEIFEAGATKNADDFEANARIVSRGSFILGL